MNKYWFTTQKTGYGIRPISVEGWLVTAALSVLSIGAAYVNGFFSGNVTLSSAAHFIFEIVCFFVAFIILFKSKTEGELRWRWKRNE